MQWKCFQCGYISRSHFTNNNKLEKVCSCNSLSGLSIALRLFIFAAMRFEAFARLIVDDGTASVILLLDGELVWTVLELSSRFSAYANGLMVRFAEFRDRENFENVVRYDGNFRFDAAVELHDNIDFINAANAEPSHVLILINSSIYYCISFTYSIHQTILFDSNFHLENLKVSSDHHKEQLETFLDESVSSNSEEYIEPPPAPSEVDEIGLEIPIDGCNH